MLKPKVVKRYPVSVGGSLYKNVEHWRFRGQNFLAYVDADGQYQLYFADKDGKTINPQPLLEWEGCSYEGALKWLNNSIE